MQALHRLGGYREYAAPADLADVVELAWVYSRAPLAPPHRVLPETAVSLAFVSQRDQSHLAYFGPINTIRVFSPPADLRMEAVRLKPEWSRDILGVDAAEHFNATDPFHEPQLLDRALRSPLQVLDILFDFIRNLRARSQRRDGVLAHRALERIRAGRALDAQMSERHVRRLIRRETGMSPKQYQRIERLNRAVARADVTPAPAWATIALDHGFYDQAHMIGEFRALTGLTPAALHAERRSEVRNLQYD